MELILFGTSLTGFRFFSAAAQSIVVVVSALIARRMGGGRVAQWVTAAVVAISPISLAASSLFQYVSFDLLWWVVLSWLLVVRIESGDRRCWIAIGGVIGLGVLTKYSIVFLIAGIVLAVVGSPLREDLKSRWLWFGVVLSIAIAAPNILWQIHHDFISLDFLRHIHERDVRIGRTDGFLVEQLYVASNAVSIPLWTCGLGALFFSQRLRRFRPVGWMVVVPFLLFVLARGRAYYTAGIFPPLICAGAVFLESLAAQWSGAKRIAAAAMAVVLWLAGASFSFIVLPLAPIGSRAFNFANEVNGDFAEEIGWPELVGEVARIWRSLPPHERVRSGVFCENYGEAGAVNLYGPAHGLPRAISGINSYWALGYGDPPPQTLIVLGSDREDLEQACQSVVVAGRVTNRWGIENEETSHPEIYVCRGLKTPWSELWPRVRSFG